MKLKLLHKGRDLIAACLWLASVFWVSFRGGVLPWLCFFAFLLQIPVFLGYLIYVNFFLKLHQGMSERRVTKAEEKPFCLVLENSGFLPIGELTVIWEERAGQITGEGKNAVRSLLPGERREEGYKLSCRYAGTYPVGVLGFSVSDLFGLVSFSFSVPEKYRAVVMPKITGDAEELLGRRLPEEEALFQNTELTEDIPGNDFRRYTAGDRAGAVNWKLYAKTGELYTRLPENRNVGLFAILLASCTLREEAIEDIIQRDRFLTFAVSAAWYFGRQGKPVELIFPAGSFKHILVDSYSGFETFYREISEGLYYGAGTDAEQAVAAEEKRLRAEGRRLFVIRERELSDAEEMPAEEESTGWRSLDAAGGTV